MCKVYYRNCLFCEHYEQLKTTSNYYSSQFGAECDDPVMVQVAVQIPCGQHDKEKPLIDFIQLHGPKKDGSGEKKVEEKKAKW
jgi:hypothetical protein